jgi:hypothetical protein
MSLHPYLCRWHFPDGFLSLLVPATGTIFWAFAQLLVLLALL